MNSNLREKKMFFWLGGGGRLEYENHFYKESRSKKKKKFFLVGGGCYETKCITRVSSKFNPQIIVGKYDTSSVCSARTIREILTRFKHVFAETCNYRILFYSVSDYINQRK